jgi:NAD(P)-dependent dehydrogenase (short-subunit alcohol dehydrogenase family)
MISYLQKFNLDGKVALITGGSRGLGLECATALAEAGARIAVLARRESFFEQTREVLPEALCLLGDVGVESDVLRAVQTVSEKMDNVDILINAAGISWSAPAMETTAEQFQQVLQVNINGVFHACKAVAPSMRERGYGKIINIASVAGIKAEPPETLDAVSYSTSKGAVIQLTRDLAMKWGRYGIRVNALAPGFFPTRMTEKVLPKIIDSFQSKNALGRPGIPGELGGCALFFASAASDYVNGDVMVVNGGPI